MLKTLRENKGISQSFVASKLKISRSRLDRIEKGVADLPTRCIPTLSDLYNCSFEKIIETHKGDMIK